MKKIFTLWTSISFILGLLVGCLCLSLFFMFLYESFGVIIRTKSKEPYKIEIMGNDTIFYFKGK